MNTLSLPGNISSALAHFVPLGVAGILEREPGVDVTLHWSDEPEPQVGITIDMGIGEISERIQSHAQQHCEPTSWVQQRVTTGRRAGIGLFTARTKAPSIDEWTDYLATRSTGRDEARLDRLDLRMQLALGEPAWWRCSANETRPDDGASRWEMKTRNQGQEFLVHRLAPLAEVVAARPRELIAGALTGRLAVDDLGGDSASSRTSTGLTRPGPTDSVLAWCALWGLHVTPTIARLDGVAQSAGVWPRHVVHPRVAALPVFTSPVNTRRFADVMASRPFDLAGPRPEVPQGEAELSKAWLRDQGVRAIVRFPVRRTGSSSAPERQLLSGELEVL